MKRGVMGIIIGAGFIMPGVSGAVLAVIFGIYDKIIKSISNLFKDFKSSIMFLYPIIIGVIIGILIFGNILNFAFDNYPNESKSIFLGLVTGGIPFLFKKIKADGQKNVHLISFITSLSIAFILFVVGEYTLNLDFTTGLQQSLSRYVILFITGVIYVSGKIIPGISSSFLLMIVGMYEYILDVIGSLLFMSLIEYFSLMPFFLGMAVGAIILIKIIKHLLANYYTITYSAITGFIIGSLPIMYPTIRINDNGLVQIVLMIVAFIISYVFSVNRNEIN